MVVAKHGPETCAAAVPAILEMAMTGFQELESIAKGLGITVQGSWANMPAHEIYVVVDAPNAHVVNRLSRETKLMNWNTVVSHPS